MSSMFSPRLGALVIAGWVAPMMGWGTEAFLQLEGIPGNATEAAHVGWIEVLSVTNRVARQPRAQPPRVLTELVVLKHIDKASPLLYKACAQRQPIPQARLELVTGEPTRLRFYQIALSNVVVQSVNTSAAGAAGSPDSSWEQLLLTCARIDWTYTVIEPQSGLPAKYITGYWDLLRSSGDTGNHTALFIVSGIQTSESEVLLRWPGASGKSYRVSSSQEVTGPYAPLTEVAALADGPITYTAPLIDAVRFFVVEEKR